MNNLKLFKRGALDSLGTTIYIFLVALFMNNASSIFGQKDNKLVTPMVVLLLFLFSALVTGSLILGKPVMLYLDGEKKQAIKLLFYTGVSLFIILIITATVLFLLK